MVANPLGRMKATGPVYRRSDLLMGLEWLSAMEADRRMAQLSRWHWERAAR